MLFCREHTCRLCVENCDFNLDLLITDPVFVVAPRNICAKHVLCNHVFKGGNICLEVLPSLSDVYCSGHLDRKEKKNEPRNSTDFLRCSGVNSKRNRCGTSRTEGDKRWWCHDHSNQAAQELSDRDEEGAAQLLIGEMIVRGLRAVQTADEKQGRSRRLQRDSLNNGSNDTLGLVACCGKSTGKKNSRCFSKTFGDPAKKWYCPLHIGHSAVVPLFPPSNVKFGSNFVSVNEEMDGTDHAIKGRGDSAEKSKSRKYDVEGEERERKLKKGGEKQSKRKRDDDSSSSRSHNRKGKMLIKQEL